MICSNILKRIVMLKHAFCMQTGMSENRLPANEVVNYS